jgi:lipoprotein-anchoring transpeptidase ErfK/SrfK
VADRRETPRTHISLYRDGRPVRRVGAGVGATATPTPTGLFAVAERDSQPNEAGFLGPWALHLTAHSNVLDDFGGGPGTIGIHGRGGASLEDPLGTARSHGCIRVHNNTIDLLARVAREGTPVLIVR